jgi:adenine-specific DNA-methyltransferase
LGSPRRKSIWRDAYESYKEESDSEGLAAALSDLRFWWMTSMEQHRDRFQALLRELFQFDCADLSFGIYRIMNHKRDVLDRFISNDLPKAVAEELARDALAEQSHAAAELKELAGQIVETLGKTAFDADGNLADAYREIPLGKKYLDLKAKAGGSGGREALEANIFNHLYAFFNRYYQDGDFISKRRYSKRHKYGLHPV